MAKTEILQITGDKSLLDLNVVFVFNYMSMEQEIALEQQQKMNKK